MYNENPTRLFFPILSYVVSEILLFILTISWMELFWKLYVTFAFMLNFVLK